MTTDPSPLPEGVTLTTMDADVTPLDIRLSRLGLLSDFDESMARDVDRLGLDGSSSPEIVWSRDVLYRLAEEVERLTNEHAAERDVTQRLMAETCAGLAAERDALRTQLTAAEARVAELEATIAKYEHVYVTTGTGQSDG